MWPNSQQINISAISECGTFMAVGLKNGTVIVWDVYRGESFSCITYNKRSHLHYYRKFLLHLNFSTLNNKILRPKIFEIFVIDVENFL